MDHVFNILDLNGRNGSGIYFEKYFEDALYDYGGDVESVSGKMTEKSVHDAIKKNKRFQRAISAMISETALNLIEATDTVAHDAKEERIFQEKRAKEQAAIEEKQEAADKLRLQKARKEKAQRDIFKEGLTATQRKSFKKLYGVDVDKFKIHSPF